MANGKKKTTMAKLNRETKMREKRSEKEARKEARKREAADGSNESSDRPSCTSQTDVVCGWRPVRVAATAAGSSSPRPTTAAT